MKRCPSCQKVFEDDKKFCQIDGTPLVEVIETPPDDPFKTVVGGSSITSSNITDDNMKTFVIGSKEKEELLNIPEEFDPMKTMVVSDSIKPPPPPVINEPVVPAPEIPKFNEPSLSPPSFGDLSGSEPPKMEEPPKIESPFSPPVNEPPKIESPFSPPVNEPPKFDQPVANPFNPPPVDPPKFESNPLPSESSVNDSPFNQAPPPPISTPFDPPPFKEPEPMFSNDPKPMSSPFDQPSTPFGQTNDPFANQQQDSAWSPPPVPVQGWQDQPVGSNTPFQPPPAGTEGQNKTMATVSLVLGILSCLCCFSIITGPLAIIFGFLAKGNITKDPMQYGGGNFATIGMITGAVGTLIAIVAIILQLVGAFAGRF